MKDKEDEARIKAYMAAKMAHIKMYNECMNLADGLDVEKFAELVRADEREKVAHEALDRMVAENQRLGLYDDGPAVKTYAGGKPNYCTPEVTPEVTPDVDNAYTKLDTTAGVLHKEWVGLTNEDIDDLWKTEYFNVHYELPRAIEAKLKEKNT